MSGLVSTPEFVVRAVGLVANSRTVLTDDGWGAVVSTIRLLAPFDARSVLGLDAFSHVEVLYVFDRVDAGAVHVHARHPRGNPSWPEVGILAQRAKDRVNRIGLSTCELLAVKGDTIEVRGLDAVDGTPVIDVKPHMAEFGPRGTVRQPAWSHELMARYFD
ncbi:MAG: TrmO family methyltransferase domain-containing protein [Acidimicrobiales bacterium]